MNTSVSLPHGYTVTNASPADVEDIVELLNHSFSRILKRLYGGAPDVGEGDRIRGRLTRRDCHCFVLKNHEEAVVGVGFIQIYGNKVVLGPVAVRAATPGKVALLTVGYAYLRELGMEHIEFVTFPHSTLHFQAYWAAGQALDVGLDAVAPTLFLTRPLRASAARPEHKGAGDPGEPLTWLSQSTLDVREAQLEAISGLNRTSPAGIENDDELRQLLAGQHGDILLYGPSAEPLGYAVCMSGPGSEAFETQQLLVKHLVVDAPSIAEKTRHLGAMTAAIEVMARRRRLQTIGMMVNALHRNMLNTLFASGFRVSSIFQLWTTRAVVYTDMAEIFRAEELR